MIGTQNKVVSATSASASTSAVGASADDIIDVDHEDDGQPPLKQQKKSTSDVWQYFTKYTVTVEENGKQVDQLWAQCKFKGCNNKTSKGRAESNRGTTGFWSHLKHYHSIVKGQQQLKSETDHEKGMTVIEPYKYDQEVSLRKLYIAIIMHEYPFNIVEHEYFVEFIKSLRPNFPIKSRITVRKDIMDLYLQEKDKMYAYFKTLQCRLSATMDMWTSNQNKGYMCVTVHWVDDDWRIQKRIINFFHVPGRHTGENMSHTLSSCMLKWNIEKKIFSLTLDNAAANEVAVKDVILGLKKYCPLICDGLFFHVRCANHILNLVAKDGMSAIASSIQNIRAFVVAVKGSPLQWEEFLKCATECGLDTKSGLSLDVSTRWNSTYTMLRDALYYRAAFERLMSCERGRYEKIAPSSAEWEKAKSLLPCLKKFFDLTELFSGTLYPTANLFFKGFCEIKFLLTDWCHSDDPTISSMATSMSFKFEKYWKKSNVALAIASVLDPRFKRKIVEFYLRRVYKNSYQDELNKFNCVMRNMYECYAASNPSSLKSKAPAPSTESDLFMDTVDEELDSYLYDTHDLDDDANDLDKYLAEPPLKVTKANYHTFDILAWWKGQRDEYPILWLLARDVLAMQVSTVASESAFSAGGRVVDPYRSRLDPEMVQALICTKDWIAAAKKGDNLNFYSCKVFTFLLMYMP